MLGRWNCSLNTMQCVLDKCAHISKTRTRYKESQSRMDSKIKPERKARCEQRPKPFPQDTEQAHRAGDWSNDTDEARAVRL